MKYASNKTELSKSASLMRHSPSTYSYSGLKRSAISTTGVTLSTTSAGSVDSRDKKSNFDQMMLLNNAARFPRKRLSQEEAVDQPDITADRAHRCVSTTASTRQIKCKYCKDSKHRCDVGPAPALAPAVVHAARLGDDIASARAYGSWNSNDLSEHVSQHANFCERCPELWPACAPPRSPRRTFRRRLRRSYGLCLGVW